MGEFLPPDLPTLLPLIILPGSAILHSASYISCNNRAPLFCFVFLFGVWAFGVGFSRCWTPSDEHSPTQPPPSLTRSPRELFNILSLALYIFGGARQTLSYPLILTSPFVHNNAELQKCQELSLIQAVSVRVF